MTEFPAARFQTFNETADPSNIAPRVALLREKLETAGLDAFLIPRADAHRGESVPAGEQRLAHITGFTGSAGIAVIARDRAALFVDGRYTLQAPAQTDTELVEIVEVPHTRPGDWIKTNFTGGGRIGFDPWLHTPGEIKGLREDTGGRVEFVPTDNLVDAIWPDRPTAPRAAAELLGVNRAGKSADDKLSDLRATLGAAQADAVVLTLPESICWLFNMRGRDVPNTPFVLGFAIVPREGKPTLFLEESKLSRSDAEALGRIAALNAPDAFGSALERLGAAQNAVWIDPASAPEAVRAALADKGARLIEKQDPVLLPKAKKNGAEIDGMRDAHRRDGMAMARFLNWFDTRASSGELTEIGIATALEAFRGMDDTLVDISFDTISGAGPDGAIVHYRVTEKTNRRLVPGELMLVDSGGQYLSGTTDITRTMASGPVTAGQKDHFTRVLKGMIAISTLEFPKGTSGAQIDAFARQALWQVGLNYAHGTGHGVGAYLGVHEGPIGISPRYPLPLEPGMIVSNEPGYYRTGEYGIRIENLIHVAESPRHEGFLGFETLTLCPIDTRLVDVGLLSPDERAWLNAYHERVLREIGPHLGESERAWLETAAAAI